MHGDVLGDAAFEKMITPDGEYACGLYAGGGTLLHGGCTDVYNSYNIIYEKDNMIIIVLLNRPIEKLSSTAVAGNIRKYWDGYY